MSKTCQCPKPPGGRVTCDDGQLAICSVDGNGEVNAACYTPPSGATQLQTQNWALAIITGEARSREQPLSNDDYVMINSGTYQRPNGTFVRFQLPNFGGSFLER